MAGEDPFEGLLAKLTTEQGKEDLVREAIERDEGVEVVRVERTSTGWRVIAVPKPGGRGKGEAGGKSGGKSYEATPDERLYWTDIHDAYGGFKIRVAELGDTRDRRDTGIDLIRGSGKSPKDIAEIEKRLVEFHGGGLNHTRNGIEPWESYCEEDLRTCLSNLHIALTGREFTEQLLIVSGYRRMGTHIPDPYGDPSGKRDAGDKERGHWLGRAVDFVKIGENDFTQLLIKDYFGGSDKLFESFLHSQGLCRPYRSGDKEKNHVTYYDESKKCPGFD